MKNQIGFLGILLVLLLSIGTLFSFKSGNYYVKHTFPYRKGGLTERQAAAHLLSRFSYGATPGQVDEVMKLGLENWFEQQLSAALPDDQVNQLLGGYSSLRMTSGQIAQTFPKVGLLRRMAMRDGVIDRDAPNQEDKEASRKVLKAYMKENNFRPQRELFRELTDQKILRAAYSQNQLQEMLTSFWFNHFNVSLTDKDCALFILTYERDVIRPNALGKFESLLLATAKSPAMLTYLDNFESAAPAEALAPDQRQREQRRQRLRRRQPNVPPGQEMQVMDSLER